MVIGNYGMKFVTVNDWASSIWSNEKANCCERNRSWLPMILMDT